MKKTASWPWRRAVSRRWIVLDMELGKVVQQIRGPREPSAPDRQPGRRRAARKIVTLVRGEIKLEDQEAKAKLIEMPNGHGGTKPRRRD